MKSLFTLFISLLAITGFAQNPMLNVHQCYRDPHTPTAYSLTHHTQPGVFRSAITMCDTDAVMDYNTYDEIVSVGANLNYDGSWNNTSGGIYAQEITSYIDTFHTYDYTYAGEIWDSLAFANYTQGTVGYFPRAQSTITLDSLIVFAGIWGDTTPGDGLMTHDSLIFNIFSLSATNTLSQQPIQTVVLSGYSALNQFFKGTNIIGGNIIPINYQFAQGESFAIAVNYIAKDTSSHFSLSYSFADSCGVQNGAAYPSMFAHDAVFAQIQPNQQGVLQSVNLDNTAVYQASGIPANCLYVYTQNWEMLPEINICVNYGVQIQSQPTAGCPGSTINLSANVFGTSSSNISYTWTSSNGVLTDPSSQSTQLTMPDSGNVTVYVTANDGVNGNVMDTFKITNDAIGVKIAGANPLYINCGSSQTITSQVSGITTNKTYVWNNTNSSTSASISVSSPGTYVVTVTNGIGCSASASVVVTYNGVSNNVNFTGDSITCVNMPLNLTNTSTDINNGWTFLWNMGNNATVFTQNANYSYTSPGYYPVTLTMDSGSCSFVSPQHYITVYNAGNVNCPTAIDNVAFNGSISMLPNPSNGNVDIIVNGVEKNIIITVYDILGAQISSYTASNVPSSFSKNFDFNSLASGTYLVKIQSGDQTAIKKLVINK